MRRVVMVLAFLVCVVLPACSDHREPEPGWEDTSAATPSRPGSPTSKPRVPGGERVTVRGTVDRGVEPNCLVLSTGERDYLLLGAGPEVRPGTEVVVHGTVRPDQATTCQQGTPLVVDDADLVEGG